MVRKSLNRFYFFGLALMATLYFFGVRPDHHSTTEVGKSVLIEKSDSIHSSCPSHHPFEIENKEEQPTTEDDESKESVHGYLPNNAVSIAFLRPTYGPKDVAPISKSQAEYRAKTYLRFRSILI